MMMQHALRFITGRLAVPLAALAVSMLCGLAYGVIERAESVGYLEAEAERLASIAAGERAALNTVKASAAAEAEATADLHAQVRDAETRADQAASQLEEIRAAQIERGDDRICRPGCILEFPEPIGQHP